jgi:pseudouridine synthase
MRLQRFLALCGFGARRSCETLIIEGRVTINGVIATLGVSVDPGKDEVWVDGNVARPERRMAYVLLNKPADTVTTLHDPEGRRTVLGCIFDVKERVFPVGRLDRDTTGVLLLTNDGELAFRLSHPRYEIQKVYEARVMGDVFDESIQRLREGVMLRDGMSAPARAEVLTRDLDSTLLRLTIHEGRKHEVKRMCSAVGHRVEKLTRVEFAGLGLGGLRPGRYRFLTDAEVDRLYRMTGMKKK